MIPEDLRPIVDALARKARSDQVNWVAAADFGVGSAEDDVVVSFPDYSLNLYRSSSDEGEPLMVLNVLNSKGRVVYGASVPDDDPDFPLLADMLRTAVRKLSGVDELLKNLRHALEKEGQVGVTGAKRHEDDLPF